MIFSACQACFLLLLPRYCPIMPTGNTLTQWPTPLPPLQILKSGIRLVELISAKNKYQQVGQPMWPTSLPPLQRLKIGIRIFNAQRQFSSGGQYDQLGAFWQICGILWLIRLKMQLSKSCVWPLSIVPNCLAQHVTDHNNSTTEVATKFGGGAPSNQDRGEALSKIRRRGSNRGDGSPCNQMKGGRPTLKWEDSNGLTALGEAVSANWSWSPNENSSRATTG